MSSTSPTPHPHGDVDIHGRPVGLALTGEMVGRVIPFRRLLHTHILPHVTPFNLIITVVVALITGGFVTLIALMIMVATNFNLLGAIE